MLTETRQFRKPSQTACPATVVMMDELYVEYELYDTLRERGHTCPAASKATANKVAAPERHALT